MRRVKAAGIWVLELIGMVGCSAMLCFCLIAFFLGVTQLFDRIAGAFR